MGFEIPSVSPEAEDQRIERERQRIRDAVADIRGRAQKVRDTRNAVLEGPGQTEEQKKMVTAPLDKQAADIEADADRLEMTIRDVK
ncbi:MAG: hypothetical protein A2831_03050 [Candidatus Yanofskybacteria bacterium RIFCSPHIGHO2_01_FULL_44_17]|uniref:Uncharacterized protein n=1 Tax=Candidatus Yanofskybacteria bacterium RIFCSPHIGHO2_01_FULL_44_17 TaxID=1802668 RepID=A0A1F8EY95_9BACT|nr:MAG: hypothetical protein A2831_03050 [Candidatus Yanofskybacteria bacterium RIFCSPHIGHO2_01_FULL_44_17]